MTSPAPPNIPELYVEEFRSDCDDCEPVGVLAAKGFLSDFFAANPEVLIQEPFGPYKKSDGTYVTFTGNDADIRQAINRLYGGNGTKSKKEFIQAAQRLMGGKPKYKIKNRTDDAPEKNPYEGIYILADEFSSILTENSPTTGPPDKDGNLGRSDMTQREFLIFMTLLVEIGSIKFAGAGGLVSTSKGPNYSKIAYPSATYPEWFALVYPDQSTGGQYELLGETMFEDDFDISSGGTHIKPFSEIKGSRTPDPNNPFQQDDVLYLKASYWNEVGMELMARIGRNYQGAIQKYARAIAKEVWKDIIFEDKKRDLLQDGLIGGDGGGLIEEVPPPKERNLTPTDFQCFLLENIAKLSAIHKPAYKHTTIVNTNNQPALALNTINHPPKGHKGVETLLSLCPEVHAALSPYIKISRVEYDEFGKLLPSTEKELEIPNFIDPTDINQIMKGDLGRAAGAGIKSFTWSLDGVQPAEVDNNISAKLVMYFQTVGDFFAGQDQAGKKNPSFLDLVIASPTIKKKGSQDIKTAKSPCPIDDELHRKYDGVNFRIKVCAGWSAPDNLDAMFPSLDAAAIQDAVNSTRVSLYLQQVRHLINFNENGSVELTIEYQASLSGLLTGKTADIFSKSPDLFDDKIEDLTEKQQKLEEKLESGSLSKDKEEKTEKEIKEILEKITEEREVDRLVKYRKLLKGLFDNDQVFTLSVPTEELLLPPYGDLTMRQRAKRAKRRQGAPTVVTSTKGTQTEIIKAVSEAATDPSNKDAAEIYSEKATQKFDAYNGRPATTLEISYFYLGDLLDNILGQIQENQGSPLDFNFFLSEVEMIDPLVAMQAKNIEAMSACGQLKNLEFLDILRRKDPTTFTELAGIVQLMNIGDIPISIDAFQLWFKNNVIQKDRDKYFFLHFVKDVCYNLITLALRSKCFGPSLDFSQRFDAQPLTLDARTKFNPGTVANIISLANAKKTLDCNESRSKLGLILISTDSRPKYLRGNFQKDLKRGIYHNYIGSSCGLVKTLNFNREDQEYLRESKIQKNGSLGAEQLRELYSVSIELVGNNLYKNGNYIYVSPMILPATKRQMQLLGLHGYYLVTSVASTITDNSFNTSITALHEGVKFAENTLLLPESYGNLPAEKIPEGYWDPLNPPEESQELQAPPLDYLNDGFGTVGGAYARGDIGLGGAMLRTGAAFGVKLRQGGKHVLEFSTAGLLDFEEVNSWRPIGDLSEYSPLNSDDETSETPSE